VGQSVAVCERACVALEAMEGTDAMLRRAAGLVNGRRLTLVKVARRREHLAVRRAGGGARTPSR
jgi:UDP-2,3-diacylglucosamine hydrolase